MAEHERMSDALRQAIERGEYEVDPDAVAEAMLTRARALRLVRQAYACSQVLEAGDSIETGRAGSCEGKTLPLEGAA